MPKHWEYPASMPGSASNAAHVSKGSLKDFQQQRLERNHIQVTRAEPFLSQRSSSSQAVNQILAFSSESSIVDPTVQLPQWYQLLRQSAQDFWRVTSIAYRLANHLLGSLFEEFAPWWKWMIFDALLKLVARYLARRVPIFETVFEAVGWL